MESASFVAVPTYPEPLERPPSWRRFQEPGGAWKYSSALLRRHLRLPQAAQPLGAERAVGAGLVAGFGLWGVCLLGSRELRASGQEPVRLSPAAALHACQRTLREYRVRPETPAETLWAQLRRARLDDYQRRSSKTSRAYPRKKHRTPIGIPHLTRAARQPPNRRSQSPATPGGISVIGVGWHSVVNLGSGATCGICRP